MPLLSVSLHETGNANPLKVINPLPASHLFEFSGLSRSKSYEVVVKNQKTMVDRRHESSITAPINDFDAFQRIIVPLRLKGVS